MKNNTLYYLAAIVLFIGLKWAHTQLDTRHLFFLLRPVAWLVGLFTGASYTCLPDTGAYEYPSLSIVIDKSCSGFNFGLLCTLMLVFQLLHVARRFFYKMTVFLGAFFAAYVLTIFANSSRIYAAIILQGQLCGHNGCESGILHQAIGIVVYLSALIAIYLIVEIIIKNKLTYAKAA